MDVGSFKTGTYRHFAPRMMKIQRTDTFNN